MNALVANAKSAPALAVIRSIGKKGIEVTGASDSKDDFPLFSKYCTRKILLKAGSDNETRIDELLEIVRNNHFDVFLPVMSENALLVLAKRKSEFEKHTRLLLPSFEQLSTLNDKASVATLLSELGCPRPETYFIDSPAILETVRKNATFPVVIKPYRGEGAAGIIVVTDPGELENSYTKTEKAFGRTMIQEFIPGDKHTAVFLLNKDSEVRRFFVHRAIREYPITGGPTCFLKSVKYEPIFEYGLKLLKSCNFTGLASMEFIVDSRDNKPKIIDVNPRFYGPLQCAISAGADFPYAVFNLAMNGDIEKDLTYRENITCRHLLFDDTKHMISVLKGVKTPKYTFGKIATVLNYLNFFGDDSYFVLSLSDPRPVLKKLIRHFS
jgi:predicted ATP-grasp superfamily ATP-dependent carboligase